MASGPDDRGTLRCFSGLDGPARLGVVSGQSDYRDLLLDAGLALSSERSLPAILQRIVELASQLTGARYGAIGVLDPNGGISQFVYTGITPEQHAAIGHLPVGKGILGVLIADPRPLRLRDLRSDPRSTGFPPNHPPMRSFLGAPVTARGRVFGNIYLTEKQGAAEFDAHDERALVVLASQAGVAVENAHLNEELEIRVQRLDALHAIGTAAVRGDDPDTVVGLVARHARTLLRADLAGTAVPSRDHRQLTVLAADGTEAESIVGEVFPLEGSVSGDAITSGRVVALGDAAVDDHVAQPIARSGVFGPALFVPMAARGKPFGTLLLARRRGREPFEDGEMRLAELFAGQAALVLEQARLQREVHRLETLEDRERIARELHDGTVQSLFTVGLGLQGTASLVGEPEAARRIQSAVEELDRVIRDLRNYIFGLEPGVLAQRQLDQALEEMVEEFQYRTGVVAIAEIDPGAAAALAQDAAEVVQLIREALSNVSRHAGAATCRVSLNRDPDANVVRLEVDDDGRGFDAAVDKGTGRGLGNLRARTARLGGRAEIVSVPGEGTTVRIAIPVQEQVER
jgi:two-component system, NarL family, sensor histidine kinase DevS